MVRAALENVTAAQALRHPTWRMGAKITIDSATLMNKGLEILEAHWLFGVPFERIDVIVHPQSIVHSMVEFVDRSVLAQLGMPDMGIPILYALTYPDRLPCPAPALDLVQLGALTFEAPDEAAFPCLALARRAGRAGGAAPLVLNAANEVAVAGFLEGRCGFTDIPRLIDDALAAHAGDRGRRPRDVPRPRRDRAPVDGERLERHPRRIGEGLIAMPSRRSSLTLTLLLGVPLLADGWSSAALLGGAFDYVVSAVVALGALIFIHELGHFMVAKAMGVGVERFSLGFGPRIFSFRRGETEYCVSIVPLGGYVKMTGEEAHGEDAIHPTTEAPPIDPAKSFSTKPLWARFLIVLAGPGMNFVLAAVIFSIVFAAVGLPVLEPTVGRTLPDSAAAQAGLRPRDRVAAIDGRPVEHWGEIEEAVLPRGGAAPRLHDPARRRATGRDPHSSQGAGADAVQRADRGLEHRRAPLPSAGRRRGARGNAGGRGRAPAARSGGDAQRAADRDVGRARGDDLDQGR